MLIECLFLPEFNNINANLLLSAITFDLNEQLYLHFAKMICFLNMIFVHIHSITLVILFVNVLNQLILHLDFQNNFQHDRNKAKTFRRFCACYYR